MICLDTNMMIWAVQNAREHDGKPMAQRARRYLEFLHSQSKQVVLPAPAVAEYLVGIPELQRRGQLELLEKRFIVLAFDVATSLFAANLLSRHGELKQIQTECGIPRQLIRVDAMIVAIAARYQVEALISHDKGLRKLASMANVNAIEIPDIPPEPDPIEPPPVPGSQQKELFEAD